MSPSRQRTLLLGAALGLASLTLWALAPSDPPDAAEARGPDAFAARPEREGVRPPPSPRPGADAHAAASQPGPLLPSSTAAPARSAAPEEPLEAGGSELRGRVVVDPGMAPAAGARIYVDGRELATCDEAGRFRLRGLPAGQHEVQAARGPLVNLLIERVELGETPTEVELTIAQGGAVLVELHHRGAPVAGARLAVRPLREERVVASGESDAQGSARLEGIWPGVFELEVERAGFATRRRIVAVGAGQWSSEHRLELQVGASLQLSVLDAGGQPLAGERVDLYPEQLVPGELGLDNPNATTSAEGVARLRGVTPGCYEVRVGGERLGAVTLRGGDEQRVELRMPRAAQARVSGSLTAQGKPVANARVSARFVAERGPGHPSGTTDSQGRFEFKGLRAGRYCVSAEGVEPVEVTLGPQEAAEVHLKLELGVIEGVVLVEGEPSAGGTLSARHLRPRSAEDRIFPPRVERGREGRFRVWLRPGKVRLLARREGVGASQVVEVEVEAGQVRRGVELSLSKGASLTLRARGPGGQPVGGARTSLLHVDHGLGAADLGRFEGTPGLTRVTDSQGELQLETLPPGRYRFLLRRDDLVGLARVELSAGEAQTLRVDLQQAASVAVSGPALAPIEVRLAGDEVPLGSLLNPGGDLHELAATNEAGSCMLHGLPPLELVLSARGAGGEVRARVRPTPGPVREARLR